jgi:hypothetical protein
VLLVAPALLLGARKVFRPHEFDFADALPLCWAAVGFLPFVFFPGRQDYHTLSMWSAVALWIACAWDRTSRALRLAGIALTALVGVVLGAGGLARFLMALGFAPSAFGQMPLLLGLTVVVACALAIYFTWNHREELAIATIMLAMVPIGLSSAEAMARFGSHFSLANAARFLGPRLGETGEVVYEGQVNGASSLRFYLEREPVIATDAAAALEKMGAAHPVYLIIHKERVPYWQEQLTERFHIYHQATTCGDRVVIDNHP